MKPLSLVSCFFGALLIAASTAQDEQPGGRRISLEFGGADPGPPIEGVAIDEEPAGSHSTAEPRRRIRVELKGPEEYLSGEDIEVAFEARGLLIEQEKTDSRGKDAKTAEPVSTLSATEWIVVNVTLRADSEGQLRVVKGDSDEQKVADAGFEGHRVSIDLEARPTPTGGFIAEAIAEWGRYSADATWELRPAPRELWTELLSTETESLDAHWTTTGNWTLENGVATLTPREGESGWSRWSAYLWSKQKYRDFDIEFEYRLEEGGNSGFYFRVGDVDDPVNQGIEVQIFATDPDKARDRLTDHDAGGIIPGLKPHRNAAKAPGEWNKMQVMHFDDKIVVMLNGVNVNAHDLGPGGQLSERPRTGWIGFQDHALPISLRNIRIRTPSAKTGSTVPAND